MATTTDATKSNPASGHLWFTTTFEEGSSGDSRRRKRRLIEEFYEGYLHAYNDDPTHTRKFEITDFNWAIVHEHGKGAVHKLDVYIEQNPPIPVPPPPLTDPPPPSQPPPRMT